MKQALRQARFLFAFILFSFLVSPLGAYPPPDHKDSYSHDAKGLEKQYEPFLKALAKRDVPAIKEAYIVFFIPDQEKWFSAYFRKEEVEQLGWDQEAENEREQNSLTTMTNLIGRGTRFHARCNPPSHDTHLGMNPRSDAFVPLQPVPVEQFEIKFISDNGKWFSILGNFVYADGAFRFVGKGAYPFWSMPDATAPKH